MSIRNVKLPIVASTVENDLYDDVIIPLLKKATIFERGVAFFHSEWIALAKDGLTQFIENGGKMKLLTSIDIDDDEFEAFKIGEEAKVNEVLKRELIDRVTITSKQNNSEWTLNYLSWMISENILEVKITINKNNRDNIYHDKVSFFLDGHDTVCTHGSINDSMHAINNRESINIFVSWNERDNDRIQHHRELFYKDWNGEHEDFIVLKIPDVIKMEFSKLKNSFNPYKVIKKEYLLVRDYQQEAINQLEQSNWRGILSMATGSGKTLTSLFALDNYLKVYKNVVVCIVVPQQHLLHQWKNIIDKKYNNPDSIICSFLKQRWGSKLFSKLRLFNRNNSNLLFIYTTYKTLIDGTFQNAIQAYKGEFLYIFDECHKLGSPKIIDKLSLLDSSARIGLTATPERWLDERGSSFINKSIGPTVFEFSLKEAIERKFLTEYEYSVILCELTIGEFAEYQDLTNQIGRSAGQTDDIDNNEKLKRLLIKRSNIIKKASNKFDAFFQVFSVNEKKYSIVYVYDQQVDEMAKEIKTRFGLVVHGIVASTPIEDRMKILKSFNDGYIDVIVAIQCLDEGVDIPNCKYAYILASSTNPREFIQRRGRILRLSEIKEYGVIYDFVSIAPNHIMVTQSEKELIVKRELPRISEFFSLAKNKNKDFTMRDYLLSINAFHLYENIEPWMMKYNTIEEEQNE